jgi:riboflavin kinase/FMN adenylyltransferase
MSLDGLFPRMPETTGDPRSILTAHPLDALPPDLTGGAVAVGNFDGVHRGHQALLARTKADARALGVKAVSLTFEPNPRTFFRPDEPVFRLTPPEARARLLTALGLDGLVVATFDRAMAGMSPDAFIETVLAGRLAARSVTVGEDFRFGAKRAGTTADLVAVGRRLGFDVDVVAPVIDGDGDRFSSSAIREALAAGDIAAANRGLGYRWFVTGTVIPGEKRGRELGFPTANIRLPADCRLRHGIYAVTLTRADGTVLPGVASYGRRPQFDNGVPLLEVYVFDFNGDLYGEQVIVTFHDWIRPEMRFATVDELVSRMGTDVEDARAMLARSGDSTALDQALARLR